MTSSVGNAVVAAAKAYFSALVARDPCADLAWSYLRRSDEILEQRPKQALERSAAVWERAEVARVSGREAILDMSMRHEASLVARGRTHELTDLYVTPCLLRLTDDGWRVAAYARAGKGRLGRRTQRSSLDSHFVRPSNVSISDRDVHIEPLLVVLQWDRANITARVSNHGSEPVRVKSCAVNLPNQLRFRPFALDQVLLLEPGGSAVVGAYRAGNPYPPTTTHLEVGMGVWDLDGKQLKNGEAIVELGPPGREILRADGWEGPFDA